MKTTDVAAFDALAALVSYPQEDVGVRVRACAAALNPMCPEAAAEIERFAAATAETPLEVLQDVYVAAFDFDPDCSLEVGWHLFGESHDRGAFMAGIRDRLERAGIDETEGLPDHLANLLPLLARDEAAASTLAAQIAPALAHVRNALRERRHFYVHLLAAIDLAVASLCADRPEARTS